MKQVRKDLETIVKGMKALTKKVEKLQGELTKIEIQILDLYTELGSQKKVAKKIGRSDSTVSKTIERARQKIISSRKNLVEARKKGYLELLGIPDL